MLRTMSCVGYLLKLFPAIAFFVFNGKMKLSVLTANAPLVVDCVVALQLLVETCDYI